jgi:hypothetical protein
LLNHVPDLRSRDAVMLQAAFRLVDLTIVALIFSAFT